jgi:hypothetical protein
MKDKNNQLPMFPTASIPFIIVIYTHTARETIV